ncbi:MAG: hypothetical protein SWI22_11550 [Pseudomonadota bacterium]|nr:hypothetical protein [Pseudomonadota bacterium]
MALVQAVRQLLPLVSGAPPSVTVYALLAVTVVVGFGLFGLGPLVGLIASVQVARGRRSATPFFAIACAAATAPVLAGLLASTAGGTGQAALLAAGLGLMVAYGLLALASARMAKRGELR